MALNPRQTLFEDDINMKIRALVALAVFPKEKMHISNVKPKANGLKFV